MESMSSGPRRVASHDLVALRWSTPHLVRGLDEFGDGEDERLPPRPSHLKLYPPGGATMKAQPVGELAFEMAEPRTGAVDGYREVNGDWRPEDAAFNEFLQSLRARALHGVQLVISDAHLGLKAAIAKVFPGASWQRCRVHFMRNVLVKVPRTQQAMVAAMIRTVFAQPDAIHVERQVKEVAATMAWQFPSSPRDAPGRERGRDRLSSLPSLLGEDLVDQPTRASQRRDQRRTNVVGIFPNDAAALRLITAVCVEAHDDRERRRPSLPQSRIYTP